MWFRRLTEMKIHSFRGEETAAEPIYLGPIEVLQLIHHFEVTSKPDSDRRLRGFGRLETVSGC
jgi:hypothetical protein